MFRIACKKIIIRQLEQFLAASLFELIFNSDEYWRDQMRTHLYDDRYGF